MFSRKMRHLTQRFGITAIIFLIVLGSSATLGTTGTMLSALVPNTNVALASSPHDDPPSQGLTLSSGATMSSTVPPLINLQGTFQLANGQALTGEYDVVFRLFRVADDRIGAEGWQETHTKLPLNDGRFQVIVGSVNEIPQALLSDAASYLSVEIVGLGEASSRQYLPRMYNLNGSNRSAQPQVELTPTPAGIRLESVTQAPPPEMPANSVSDSITRTLRPQSVLSPNASAQIESIPSVMGYQGILRDSLGNVLTGIYSVTFRIYDDINKPLTSAIYIQTNISVTVRNGSFSVLLGSITPLPSALFGGPDRFIGVQVAGFNELVPRQRLASAPFAFNAAHADNANYASAAGRADTAGRADSAARADTAGRADSAAYADQAGDLRNYYSYSAFAWAVNGGNGDAPIGNGRFCYLTKVELSGIGNNDEHGMCEVYSKNPNDWWIHAYAGPNNGTENGAWCNVTCVGW